MKKFIITMDTEGDNLWNWHEGDEITTHNTHYLLRFQQLCEKYGFKPVWLTNYEMIMGPDYVEFIKNVEKNQTGELGMHLHAWNSPPLYKLPIANDGQPYLIEYPKNIMEEKVKFLTDLIYEKTGIRPISHRAGRWAMNQEYFNIIGKYGYKIDCSVTPGIDWSHIVGRTKDSAGSNYKNCPHSIYNVELPERTKLTEVPVSILLSHRYFCDVNAPIKKQIKKIWHSIKGYPIWLRPNGSNLKEMKYLLRCHTKTDDPYVMFMLHSSELMPSGSPSFKTDNQIEALYRDIAEVFDYAKALGYEGSTLRELI